MDIGRRVEQLSNEGQIVGRFAYPLQHKRIRDISVAVVSHRQGRIQSDPAGAPTPKTGSDHPLPSSENKEAALMVASLSPTTDIEHRDHAISLLDAIRDQYESARINRLRYMQYGRKYGLSASEIGAILGITEGGVRQALRRAGDLD